MTNSYYNHTTGEPIVSTRGRSNKMRTEFDEVEDGFDAVEAALAPKASPTFTGTVTAAAITASGLITANAAIKFPATQAASADANTLDDYEEALGSSGWTPADDSGAGLSFSSVSAQYVKIGRMVYVQLLLTYPATGDTSQALIDGLPFTPMSAVFAALSVSSGLPSDSMTAYITSSGGGQIFMRYAGGTVVTNNLLSGRAVSMSGWYIATA